MRLLEHCVVGVDGSDGSAAAFSWALAQAGTSASGRVLAVNAFLPITEPFAAANANLDPVRAEHRQLLEGAWTEAAQKSGVSLKTELIEGEPAAALLSAAQQHGGLPIVIGHQGHSRWSDRHVGHVAGQLLRRSDGPVVLTTTSASTEPVKGTVVLGVHGPADSSHPPVAWASAFAEERGLPLHVLIVTTPLVVGPGYGYPREVYERDLASVDQENRAGTAELVADLAAAHPSLTVASEVLFGHPTDVLADAVAGLDAGLVVIGSHHPSALASFIANGVALNLPPRVGCPTVVVPADGDDAVATRK